MNDVHLVVERKDTALAPHLVRDWVKQMLGPNFTVKLADRKPCTGCLGCYTAHCGEEA